MSDGSFVVSALRCGSWSCSHCRKINAARLLERVHDGMATRQNWQTFLVTFTVNPADWGGVPRSYNAYQNGRIMPLESDGSRLDMWDLDIMPDAAFREMGVRMSPHYQSPTLEQYQDVAYFMSREFGRLRRRLSMRAKRAGAESPHYLRVAELHRSGWLHYHVVFQLPPNLSARHLHEVVSGWGFGRTDVREVSSSDAVSHVVPYLTSEETHRNKGYQFAGDALPKNFRLWTSSQGFLGASPDIVAAARKVVAEHDLSDSLADDYIASITPIQVVADGRHVTKVLDDFRALYDEAVSVTWALHNDSNNPARFTLRHDAAAHWFATLPAFERLQRVPSPEARRAAAIPESETYDDLTAYWLDCANRQFFEHPPSRDWSAAFSVGSSSASRQSLGASQGRLYFGGKT